MYADKGNKRLEGTIVFSSLYKQFYRKAVIFTKSYVRDELVAEDIATESLMKVWEKMREKEMEHPEYLLLTIIKNKALDYLRHQKIKREALSVLADVSSRELALRISTLKACDPAEIFSEEVYVLINRTLQSLSPQTRKIFVMSRYEDKAVKDIATELGLTSKAVEYHITKALKTFRKVLKDYIFLLLFT